MLAIQAYRFKVLPSISPNAISQQTLFPAIKIPTNNFLDIPFPDSGFPDTNFPNSKFSDNVFYDNIFPDNITSAEQHRNINITKNRKVYAGDEVELLNNF